MKKRISLILGLFLLLDLFGQDSIVYNNQTINRIDNKKHRQGLWKVFSPDDSLHLECFFLDDTIINEIKIFKKGTNIITFSNPNGNNKKFIAYYNSDTIQGYISTVSDIPEVLDSQGLEVKDDFKDWLGKNSSIMPMYYGGPENLRKFVEDNVDASVTRGKKGRVAAQFVVNKYGYVTNVRLIQKSAGNLNKETLRVMRMVPRWQPGFQLGRFVKVLYTYPINYL